MRTSVRGALALASSLAVLASSACKRTPPPGDEPSPGPSSAVVGTPEIPKALVSPPAPSTPPPAPSVEVPYTGPYFAVTRSSAGVYADTTFDKKAKVGYLRSGGRTPVDGEPIRKDNCDAGWYRVLDGGYVCGNDGTTKLDSSKVKFATRQPNLDEVLPYTYARNAKNGTPLYKSVPTPEQMRQYEPYLDVEKKKKDGKKVSKDTEEKKAEKKTEKSERTEKTAARSDETVQASTAPLPFSAEAIRAARERTESGAAALLQVEEMPTSMDAGAPEASWWQRDDADERLHEVSLEQLAADEDDLLAKRMVKGFYVAVDKQFSWNGRPWYKTTKGLVTPADRFWVTKGSEFKGVELDGEQLTLPVAWAHGWQKSRPTYRLDTETNQLKNGPSLDRFAMVPLTGKQLAHGGKTYLETKDGAWVRESHLRVTRPGPPPVDLGPNERWVDVNLDTQTLVLFEGTRPIYATLVSSGKESRDKDKDHRTPTGEWRIREKHVTTTMDGDGSAAGDLPYSIEDVPYVMYFYRAYALHGAFWHQNYGTQMSHGCVNLAPLDAKYVFMNTEPRLSRGFHGVWASDDRPGSRVVIHE